MVTEAVVVLFLCFWASFSELNSTVGLKFCGVSKEKKIAKIHETIC